MFTLVTEWPDGTDSRYQMPRDEFTGLMTSINEAAICCIMNTSMEEVEYGS